MKKLIVTADDYGMSKAVNDAIDAGIAAGLITTTNVMTNMPYYKEAAKLKNNPNISVGLHWVLACGKPVLPKEEIPTLVAENGEFFPYPEFRSRLRKKRPNGIWRWTFFWKSMWPERRANSALLRRKQKKRQGKFPNFPMYTFRDL